MGLVELYKRKLNDCKSRLILAQCHKIKLLRRDLQAYKGHLQSTSTLQTLVCHEDKILNTNTRTVLWHQVILISSARLRELEKIS